MTKDKKTTSRAAGTRTKTERPKEYKPPSSLDAPKAPDGFRHRWIRAESVGFQDSKNIFGRLREGYELVRADEYKDSDYPVVTDGKYAGVIGVGGLLLARIPIELAEARMALLAWHQNHRRGSQGVGQVAEARTSLLAWHQNHRRGRGRIK